MLTCTLSDHLSLPPSAVITVDSKVLKVSYNTTRTCNPNTITDLNPQHLSTSICREQPPRQAASSLTPYVVKLYTATGTHAARIARIRPCKLSSLHSQNFLPFKFTSTSKTFPSAGPSSPVPKLSMCVVRQMEASATFIGSLAIPGVGRMDGWLRRWEDRTYHLYSKDARTFRSSPLLLRHSLSSFTLSSDSAVHMPQATRSPLDVT